VNTIPNYKEYTWDICALHPLLVTLMENETAYGSPDRIHLIGLKIDISQ